MAHKFLFGLKCIRVQTFVARAILLAAIYAGFHLRANAADRTWIGNNNDWFDNGSTANWLQADEPDSDDAAIFNTPHTVDMASNNEINGLTLSNGIDLSTNGFDLLVDGLVQLSGGSTNLFIDGATSELNADDVTINGGGTVELSGGTLVADDEGALANGILTIAAGGTLTGNGTVILADTPLGATALLNNIGTITAVTRVAIIGQSPLANTLAIDSSSVLARIDLDGTSENGVARVNRNQTLDINVTLADEFNGTINLTHNATLDIAGAWTLGASGQVFVDNGETMGIPVIPAGTSMIAGGTLTQTGGTITIVDNDGELQFDAPFLMNGGNFVANGHVIFNADATIDVGANFTRPTDSSNITVEAGRTLTINQSNFDLDGNLNTTSFITVNAGGSVVANLGDYDPGQATNSYSSTINLNNGDFSVNTADARFVMNGTLNMHSSIDGQITSWTGEPIDIGNDNGTNDAAVNVTGTELSTIGNTVVFKSDAAVNIANGATLAFSGMVNFDTVNGANHAQFSGGGILRFNAAVNVNEAVTLDVGTVDLDGADSVGDQIVVLAPLVINAQTVSSFGKVNAGGGVNLIDVNALTVGTTGSLTVNLANPNGEWTLNPEGVIRFFNTNNLVTMLAGSDVNLNGTVNVTGAVGTAARVDIGGTVDILTAVPDGGFLLQGGSLADPNTIAGGLINGPGALQALTGRALVGFGTINAGIDFGGTAELVADDGTLLLAGPVFEVAQIGVSNDGVLDFGMPFSTGVTDDGIVINGGTLQGAAVTTASIAKSIHGTGMINSSVINDGAIEAQGGTLALSNVNSDWDGGSNAGHLRASGGGTLHVLDNAGFSFGGSVIAVENSKVLTDGFDITFSGGSSIILTQGTYESTNSASINGNAIVGAGGPSTIKVQINRFLEFEPTSQTTLNGNLRLESNNATIRAGATFSGPGALVVPAGSNNLIAAADSNINVLVDVQGNFFPGGFLAVGRVDMKDYQQSSTGRFKAEIAGTSLNQFDRLLVNGAAQLGGTLELDLISGFVPSLGDLPLTIIAAPGGVIGTFSNVIQDPAMPAGLLYKVQYSPTLVQLIVTAGIAGDYNADGVVNAADYAVWRDRLGSNSSLPNDPIGGTINQQQYEQWQANFGQVAGSGAQFNSNVPEPASLAMTFLVLATVYVQVIRHNCV